MSRPAGAGKSENEVSSGEDVRRQDSQTTPSVSPNRKTPPTPPAASKQVGSRPSSSNSLTVTSPEGPAPITATLLANRPSARPTRRYPAAGSRIKSGDTVEMISPCRRPRSRARSVGPSERSVAQEDAPDLG